MQRTHNSTALFIDDEELINRPIWLEELVCTGQEQKVSECQHAAWGKTDCGHKEDAGCICSPSPSLSPARGKSRQLERTLMTIIFSV